MLPIVFYAFNFIIVKVKPLNVTTMRKITFFIMAAVAVLTATAQDNVPDAFDSDTAYWVTSMESEYESSYTAPIVTVYRSCGDSVVDGVTWKKMYSCILSPTDIKTTRLYFDELDFGNECVGLTRKDGDVVYGVVLNPDGFVRQAEMCESGVQVQLYDFSGDFPTESFCGFERKVYYYAAEGIGDFFGGPFGPVQLLVAGQNPNLRLCISDGITIFEDNSMTDRYTELKLCYDMLNHTIYSYNNETVWTIGRVADGAVVSTYDISRSARQWYGDTFYSDALSGQELEIEKPVIELEGMNFIFFPDLATITIDGETRNLYDFGLDVGEVFDNGVVRLEVTEVDTAFFEGYERRVLTMDSGEQWIDGIGSTRGLLAPVTEPTDGYEEVLLSCRSGDVVMYVNPVYGSGIDERYAATASAYVSDGTLHVTATTTGGHTVSVVAMDGTEVVRTTFSGTSLSRQLPDLPHGVYAIIVADDGEVACRAKVVL